MLTAEIFMTLLYSLSQSAITFGRSSRRPPVDAKSWWMEVFVSWLTLVCQCVVLNRTLLMSLSLLLQQCWAYLANFSWVWVFLNSISNYLGHLMPKTVKLVLSSMWVLGFRLWVCMIVFDYIWPDFSEKVDLVGFWWKGFFVFFFWKT